MTDGTKVVEGGKENEMVLASQTELVRRLPILAGLVEKFEPDCAVVVPIASFVFAADLLRQGTLWKLPVYFVNVRPRKEDENLFVVEPRPFPSATYRRILLIESCLDSGHTLLRTKEYLQMCGADKVCSIVAVDKSVKDAVTKCSGSLFKMPESESHQYIYGYGMDAGDGSRRGLPYIAYRATGTLTGRTSAS